MNWKSAFEGGGKAFVGGVLGAVATALIAYATGVGGKLLDAYYQDQARSLFQHLDTTVYSGERMDARHMSAKCLGENEILVAGYCEVDPGAPGAVLENAGVYKDKKSYQCVYNNDTIANAHAVCLRVK